MVILRICWVLGSGSIESLSPPHLSRSSVALVSHSVYVKQAQLSHLANLVIVNTPRRFRQLEASAEGCAQLRRDVRRMEHASATAQTRRIAWLWEGLD